MADPLAEAAAIVVVESGKAVIAAINRPRQDENWAGAGTYEEAFLRELSKTFATSRYALIDQNAPILVDLYDGMVSYGKAMYPNKRGMVGAGEDINEIAKNWVQRFIAESGGARTFAFLFRDLQEEEAHQQAKKALQEQIARIKRQKFLLQVVLPIGGVAVVGGGLLIWRYYANRNTS